MSILRYFRDLSRHYFLSSKGGGPAPECPPELLEIRRIEGRCTQCGEMIKPRALQAASPKTKDYICSQCGGSGSRVESWDDHKAVQRSPYE